MFVSVVCVGWLVRRPATIAAAVKLVLLVACGFGVVIGLAIWASVPSLRLWLGKWLVVAILFFVVVNQLVALLAWFRVKTWHSAAATVTDVSLAPTLDSLHVRYVFVIEGTPYAGCRYRTDQGDRRVSQWRSKHWLDRYAKGKVLTVWFDPTDPDSSVLQRSSLISLVFRLSGVLLLFAGSLYVMLK